MQRLLPVCLLLLSALVLPGPLQAVDAAGPQDAAAEARQLFRATVARIRSGAAVLIPAELREYTLAPYLEHARLARELPSLGHDRARSFLAAEADSSLGRHFRRQYLGELARRGDWAGFLAFDDPEVANDVGLRCQRLRALLNTGRADDTREELLALWRTGRSLPDACDDPIAHGRARGWIDRDRIRERLELALDEGQAGLVRYLARQLPEPERAAGERLARALSSPRATLADATGWPDTPEHRRAAVEALKRQARADVERALAAWPALDRRFGFNAEERGAALRALALWAAVAYRDDAGRWYERVPERARTSQLTEWQLRAALATRDWPAVLGAAEHATMALDGEARPRYWLARALAESGRRSEAVPVYASLAAEASYFGFLAADASDRPYALCPLDVEPRPERLGELRRDRELARALELHAVGWRTEAVRAWRHATLHMDEADLEQALLLANAQGWHDRAVLALGRDDKLRHYALRFPVDSRELVVDAAGAQGLDPAFTFALIRAESAWQPDARSHANALGLMQLLPSTGRRVARELGIPWRGEGTLLEPALNIRLGTRYLANQLEQFGGSPWLASAAYNAGPAPVRRWLGERPDLPADAFIETIPYGETRDYVARVLAFSVIYDWRLYGRAKPISSRLPAPGRPAEVSPAWRPVACPA